MIRMGRAAAYDIKILIPTLGIMAIALTAACTFSGKGQGAANDGPKLQLGG